MLGRGLQRTADKHEHALNIDKVITIGLDFNEIMKSRQWMPRGLIRQTNEHLAMQAHETSSLTWPFMQDWPFGKQL